MQHTETNYSLVGPEDIARSQFLLIHLRHSAKCNCGKGECQFSPVGCPETKDLWNHILACDNSACVMPGCKDAVQILKHHQGCKQQCAICTPAKVIMDTIRTQPRDVASAGQDWGSEETILERMNKIYRTMEVLKHTSTCVNPLCTFDSCSKVKELFQHAVGCAARAEGGCNPCRRLWGVLQLHSRQCRLRACPVPRCQDLRDMAQRRQVYRDVRKDAHNQPSTRRKRHIGTAAYTKQVELRMERFCKDSDEMFLPL